MGRATRPLPFARRRADEAGGDRCASGCLVQPRRAVWTGGGKKTMVVFSDMSEDLPRGVKRDMAPDELKGVRVLAMNVKRLAADNADPATYRQRLSGWEKQVTTHGARDFKVVLEPDKLTELLDEG